MSSRPAIKNPSPLGAERGCWKSNLTETKQPTHSLSEAPPPSVAKAATGRHGAKYRRAERPASTAPCRVTLLFPCGFQVFLVFAGQFHEAGRQAHVFVHRVALIVMGDHFGTP